MAITQIREVARADMNDQYGVTCYQESEFVDLTAAEARAYAMEIMRAADSADIAKSEDREQTFTSPIAPTGEAAF